MNVVLIGYGMMGKLIEEKLTQLGHKIAGVVSLDKLQTLDEVKNEYDVVIDFSHPDNLEMIIETLSKTRKPVVFATTGYSDEQISRIKELSDSVPVVYSANYSLGITVMEEVLKMITPILEDSFDIEVIEKHHNKKLDAPSGTAKMLVNAMNGDNRYKEVYGRSGARYREKEIGVHAVRGGSIVGEHSVIYAGEDEVLEIKHEAHSKAIFANGAIKAACFIVHELAGLYNMHDVLFKK